MTSFTACTPAPETTVLDSTATKSIIPPKALTITSTPSQLAVFTQKPKSCSSDDELPNPDIPDNYIGWKPGFDFAKQYVGESNNGNFLYWEYDDGNIRHAGYKRNDNSFLFFLEKFLCRDNKGARVFEVVDAVRTRPLSEEEDMAPPNYVCYLMGTDGVTVEAVVIAIVNTKSLSAKQVWSVDSEKIDIQEISLERIRCASAGIIAPKP